ncbi:sensor histidine kinase [Paenibacillus harenae]|uniref:sensor histidine kinase n=1 Tax=Paenibacillus harenae TaxID=306543 RepID=UPI002791E509|nr:histidine kinase [Paenibacillus harenae]MDQ0062188.1 sensor histidine kinase YesM [Paenibacillus harenae]
MRGKKFGDYALDGGIYLVLTLMGLITLLPFANVLSKAPSPVNGDFHMLERSVDHLILRVRTLVEEKYKAQIHEREAQLQALQAQINPHFLYNTLDTINWIAIGKGATDISGMIDSLAKYFRLKSEQGQKHRQRGCNR